jgi:Methyltransferase FkbM domain
MVYFCDEPIADMTSIAPKTVFDVDVRRVDDLIPAGEKIQIVKIDFEGLEDKILKGMTRMLSESRPTIFFECIPQGPRVEVEKILRALEYQLSYLEPGRIVPVQSLRPPAEGKLHNFMARGADSGEGLCNLADPIVAKIHD